MRSTDLIQESVKKIGSLFPDAITESYNGEGALVYSIDFDTLREDLSGAIVEGKRERYQFTWPGKARAKLEARTPTVKTMHPVPERSVNWDTTQNLYIEGDNLEALKIMRETYAGRIKLIYIDPPYNTGHDFIYDDDFSESQADYAEKSGEYDEEGGRLVANLESNGRFHSDWCSMMYPRLLLARDLLTSDGAIFISIDDNESANLRKICDEIFGVTNFIADVVWKHTQQSKNDERHFARMYNHTLVFAKDEQQLPSFHFERTEEDNVNYSNPDSDPNGPWRSGDVRSPSFRKTLRYTITAPDGSLILPPDNGWRWSSETVQSKIKSGEIVFKKDYSGIIRKIYLKNQFGRTPENLWDSPRFGTSRQAAASIKNLFNGVQVFDTPKPIELIEAMMELVTSPSDEDIVLDFFSGSASTAHAVMRANCRDGGNRKFIVIQIPEPISENAPAFSMGISDIASLGEERVRRAGAIILEEAHEAASQPKLGEEPKPLPDVGFRVLRVDDSCLKDTYATPGEYTQATLDDLIDNMEDESKDLDLLFQVLPKFRIPYSANIEKQSIADKTIYAVNGNTLLACFDEAVSTEVLEAIAKERPYYAVFRDTSMRDDATVANLEELFKTFSPDTVRRVI